LNIVTKGRAGVSVDTTSTLTTLAGAPFWPTTTEPVRSRMAPTWAPGSTSTKTLDALETLRLS
jgi:hypothetical protein